jgi:hypothetical protein
VLTDKNGRSLAKGMQVKVVNPASAQFGQVARIQAIQANDNLLILVNNERIAPPDPSLPAWLADAVVGTGFLVAPEDVVAIDPLH